MTASQADPTGSDPSVQLPPGALPPPNEPRRRLAPREWWYVNKWVIIAIVVIVVVPPGLWAAESVGVIPTTQHYHLALAPTSTVGNDYFAWVFIDQNHGGTLSGTFWAPYGSVQTFFAMIGDSSYVVQNVSSGSFHVSTSCNTCDGNFLVYTNALVTVYVNGTNSYLAPLI